MNRILATCLITTAIAVPVFGAATAASAQVSLDVEVAYGPPPLPRYVQPPCPGAGYLWTPGYWGYGPWGYYWVPGAWVLAPAVGMVWTPGYWSWGDGLYWWHTGYWGSVVGFYGGIDYGYGYPGYGYFGGYWQRRAFYYNRAITNVNVTYIHNTYEQAVANAVSAASRVSYNGGAGGIHVRPTANQLRYAREQHLAPAAIQLRRERWARDNPAQRFALNQGRPQIAATGRPDEYTSAGVVHKNAQQDRYAYRAPEHGATNYQREFQDARHDRAGAVQSRFRNQVPVPSEPQIQPQHADREFPPARSMLQSRPAPMHAVAPHSTVPPVFERPAVVRPPVTYRNAPRVELRRQPLPVNRDAWQRERQPAVRPKAFQRAPVFRAVARVEARPVARVSGSRESGHPRSRPC